jgi:hypothetical protein
MSGYWTLKVGALDSLLWRTRFGRDNGPVVKTDYEPNDNDDVPYKVRRVPALCTDTHTNMIGLICDHKTERL